VQSLELDRFSMSESLLAKAARASQVIDRALTRVSAAGDLIGMGLQLVRPHHAASARARIFQTMEKA